MNVKAIMFNKQILLALGMIVFIGAVVASSTGAFFSSQAAAVGNTFAAGTLDLKIAENSNSNTPTGGWLDTQTAAWNLANLTPGGDIEEDAVWLKNVGSVDGMTLGVALDNTTASVPGTAAQMRITEMTLDGDSLLEGGAGHNFALYEAPTNCDIEVNFGDNDYTRISEAVDNASANDVICVGPGNYSNTWETNGGGTGFPIRIDADNVTVASVDGPAATTVGGGFIIDNPGVTLSGFTINGESTLLSETFAVYVNGAAVGAEVSFNDLVGADTVPSRGVVTATGVSNVEVVNNQATNWATGVYFNPSTGMTASYNTLEDNNVGISNDNPVGNVVTFNNIVNNALEGVGVLYESGDTLTLEMNNISGNAVDVAQYGTKTVVAENNWWGDFDPSDQTSGLVTTTNFAGGPFAGFVNGNDANGNGYADLQDLANDPILDAGVGLDADEEKQFVMAIQLDGPTTDNSFQGASLETDIEFTLNQI